MKTILKRCAHCGAMVEVLEDCHCKNCGIMCCGEKMVDVPVNGTDGALEKHLPVVKKVGSYIVAEVPHVMQDDHYIMWIGLSTKEVSAKKYFKPTDEPKAVFPYIKGSSVIAYCNKHGLYKTDVK